MCHLHHWLSNFLETVDWSGFLSAELLLAVPTAFCLLVWLRSPLVRPLRRLMVTVAVLSLIGWAVVVGEFVRHPPEMVLRPFAHWRLDGRMLGSSECRSCCCRFSCVSFMALQLGFGERRQVPGLAA